MTLDTHRAVKKLEDVGFDENAAEAMVSLVRIAVTDNIATKSDIADMSTKADIAEMATKADIADMATKADIADMATKADIAELRTEIRELDARMTVRFVWMAMGIVIITTSLTSGVVSLLNQLQG